METESSKLPVTGTFLSCPPCPLVLSKKSPNSCKKTHLHGSHCLGNSKSFGAVCLERANTNVIFKSQRHSLWEALHPSLQTPAQQAWGPEWGQGHREPRRQAPKHAPFWMPPWAYRILLLTPKAFFKKNLRCNGILLSHKQELNSAFFINMEGPGDCHSVKEVRKTNTLMHVCRI